MATAREEVLALVQEALRDVPVTECPEDLPAARERRAADDGGPERRVARFAERVADDRGNVRLVARADLPAAVAETGTIVLDGGARQGRRAITLLPDYHLCVVEASQIVGTVPDAIAALDAAARERRPITFVSGPSATSDLELRRFEGVHGPRSLEVLVVD